MTQEWGNFYIHSCVNNSLGNKTGILVRTISCCYSGKLSEIA